MAVDRGALPKPITRQLAFEVLALDRGHDFYEGEIYLDAHLVYETRAHVDAYPAGLEDFANVTVRKFARALKSLLEEDGE